MYRVVTRITFVQQPTADFPNRNRSLIYGFVTQYDASSSWQDLANTARIVLPKNVYVRDGNGKLIPLGGTTVNIGGFSNDTPLFLRGDKVTIEAGYRFYDTQNNEKLQTSVIFTGFITKVGSRKPIELECMDNTWALQQIQCVNKTYPASASMEDILKDILKGTPYTVNVTTNTSLGQFTVQNETVAEILARLRKDYHFYATFRGGTELRVGSIVYLEQDAIDSGVKTFKFQQNIISDDLEYNRADDVELSAVAYSINKVELNSTNKQGRAKTKHKRLEVLVTLRKGKIIAITKPEGSHAHYAPNVIGERRTLHFWNVPTTDKLVELAAAELKKYYYSGMRGKFTTFGIPFIQQGDNINIIDPIFPERNGRYKVRSVKYSGGIIGVRQEIEVDYLITKIDGNGNAVS